MSEYQYYEFQAIDRPLDEAAQRVLRQISSRARITAHSLVNTYQWGDFKGDPRRLIEGWFDLFVYWANWGSRTLMLRVPRRFLDPAEVEPYRLEDVVDLRAAGPRRVSAIRCRVTGTAAARADGTATGSAARARSARPRPTRAGW